MNNRQRDALVGFCDAVELAAVKLRENLAEQEHGPAQPPFDVLNIQWLIAEGPKGTYEYSQDMDNPDHRALLKMVTEHGGRMTHGDYFYWGFRDDISVGRKPDLRVKRR